MMPSATDTPIVGQWVSGYDVPVINERAVRAAAGLLFLVGAVAFGFALHTGSTQPLQPFGMFFLIDMTLRLFVGDRWSPSIALGRLIVSRQQPEWVGAPQKVFAWSLGLILAAISCAGMGLLQMPTALTFVLCGLCLTLLFFEAAFGICVGCSLQKLFSKTPPQYCPGDTCAVNTAVSLPPAARNG